MGISDSEDDALASVYLMEPLRAPSAVLKFSGTLGQCTRSDKRTATILAFGQFVMDNTACKYMSADIQGAHCPHQYTCDVLHD